MSTSNTEHARSGLSPYLSPVGAWAFSLGTAIGWGSLVVTSNSYLLQAGPLGSVVGLVLGAAVMAVVARSYHYLIGRFSSPGGAYTYAKEVLGYDYGFLTAWFLGLVYLAILWANATSLPLFARYFLGDWLKVGHCLTVFGYDVYLGEALLSICAMLAVAWACSRSRKAVMHAMVALALLLAACIALCFFASLAGHVGGKRTLEPLLLPNKGTLEQVLRIECMSSWAFIGFENISHLSDEYDFPRARSFRIMVAAIVTATVLYAFVMLLSVMAFPPEYASWHEYLADLSNLRGIKGMPAFYAAWRFMGNTGVHLLMAALLGLVVTSLIGNVTALSRLVYALAADDVLPRRFARVNERAIPSQAVLLVAVVSLPVPFLGRTAIGWIVDVTTIGATTIYALVCLFARKVGIARGDRREHVTGTVGLVLMVACGLSLLLPNLLLQSNDLAYESYFIFAAWGILGFVMFRLLLGKDAHRRFGRSIVVWIGLLSVVMLVSFAWTIQSVVDAVDQGAAQLDMLVADQATSPLAGQTLGGGIDLAHDNVVSSILAISLVGAAILALAAFMLMSNFSYLSKWAQQSERELLSTRDTIRTDALTGLPSATRFNDLVPLAADSIWNEGSSPVVLAFDLTGMKNFNARNGHTAGDRLLRAFANELRTTFGDERCSRPADDSFYAIAPQDDLARHVEDLFARFARSNGGKVLPVRAGAYVCRPGDDIASAGLDFARHARDLDRTTWRSHLTWYSEGMSDEAKSRLYVLDHLNKAIEQRWIRPYYQAVVDPLTGRVCGEEALARWMGPEGEFLAPSQFIPVVEKAGLMHRVDMHMIDCVIEDMGTKLAAGMQLVPVSVNVSLHDLGHVDIARGIASRMDAAGLSHDLLHVEFTESVASKDPEALRSAIGALRAEGFQVWMDDFGSGYSSLNSLKDFDFDVVKLDMEFIHGAQTAKTWDIVTGVIDITKRIGARSLAEGIETEAQARNLVEAGCDMLQGYLYSRPIPLDEVIDTRRH